MAAGLVLAGLWAAQRPFSTARSPAIESCDRECQSDGLRGADASSPTAQRRLRVESCLAPCIGLCATAPGTPCEAPPVRQRRADFSASDAANLPRHIALAQSIHRPRHVSRQCALVDAGPQGEASLPCRWGSSVPMDALPSRCRHLQCGQPARTERNRSDFATSSRRSLRSACTVHCLPTHHSGATSRWRLLGADRLHRLSGGVRRGQPFGELRQTSTRSGRPHAAR